MPNHEDSRQEPSHPEVCLPVQTPLAGQNSTRSPHQSQPIPVSDMAPIHLKAAQGTPVAKLIVSPKEARPGENMRKEPSKIHSAHGCTRESEQGGRATPRCIRTLPYRPPNRGKVVSVRRNRNPTSTTRERERVCRWEARAWPQLDKVTLQYVTKAHGQWGRRRSPAIHGRRWGANWVYPATRLNGRAVRRTVV